MAGPLHLGTAGWSLPRQAQAEFPGEGSHLERYAGRFGAVEINSSFHRPHRPATYARWAAAVPAGFRFSVKLPKEITHRRRLHDIGEPLAAFLGEAAPLGEKLGCLLVQLPPSLAFDAVVARSFFAALAEQSSASIACEPRHGSWFAAEADGLLAGLRIARVAADPARMPAAAEPGGWRGWSYFRLHGSPRIYYSAYAEDFLASLAERVDAERTASHPVWCIFDNTTLGAATGNALQLQRLTDS